MNLRDIQEAAMEYRCSAGGTYEGHHVEDFDLANVNRLTGSIKILCTKCRKQVWISLEDYDPYVSHVSPYGG
jgi:hypothetical protein